MVEYDYDLALTNIARASTDALRCIRVCREEVGDNKSKLTLCFAGQEIASVVVDDALEPYMDRKQGLLKMLDELRRGQDG